MEPCKFGVECTDFNISHRAAFTHPDGITMACQYGSKCYRKNLEHLQRFVHPGDRNYRLGMVHFPKRRGSRIQAEFGTLRDLFNYCDPDESGNISRDEFQDAWCCLQTLPAEMFGEDGNNLRELAGSIEHAWAQAAGESTHLTFAQFAKWAHDVELRLPVGVDVGEGADRVCRFQYAGGGRCPCAKYEQGAQANMCTCNHKSSVHLSDIAQMSFEEQEVLTKLRRRSFAHLGTASLSGIAAPRPRKPGFTMVTDKEVLRDLQQLLNKTRKLDDNWTRDRGCALHGRNACAVDCITRHKAPVPSCYELVRAEHNRNPALWQTFATTRAAIQEECRSSSVPFETFQPLSCLDVTSEEPLDPAINEWRLLHGSNLEAIKAICTSNFRMKLAGTGATWKDGGKEVGTPLYGYGIYLAECSTKADEYAVTIAEGLPLDIGCCAMLVCRVVGGLCRLVDTNEFDTEQLRADVLDGPYHSVFGDRVAKLGKPFREIVAYDSAQVFPEFILYYRRLD